MAQDDAAIYQSIFGTDGVFNIGSKFAASILSNNSVRVSDGVLCVGGHIARTAYADYQDMVIENGASGQNRNDIIVAKFLTEGSVDTLTLEVKKGTPGSAATDPALTQDNLYQGGTTREYPLWRVKLEGLSITDVEQMYTEIPTIPELLAKINTLNTNLGNKFDKANIFTVSGYLTNTSTNTAFNLGKTYSTPPYLLAAQIQLTNGVWSDLRTLDGITRIDNNTNQVNVIKETAATYANYLVRFVFLAA